jgi:hypothetical protein
MKPFVAIDGVLDNLFFIFFRCTSVEKCGQTEILVCSFEAVPGPGMVFLSRTASNEQTSISVWAHSASKMP